MSLLEDRLVRVKSRDIEILVQRIFTKWNWYFISTLICSRNFTRASFHFSISNFEFFKKKIINQKLSESISRLICAKKRIDQWYMRTWRFEPDYEPYHMYRYMKKHIICSVWYAPYDIYPYSPIYDMSFIVWSNSIFPGLHNLITCMTKSINIIFEIGPFAPFLFNGWYPSVDNIRICGWIHIRGDWVTISDPARVDIDKLVTLSNRFRNGYILPPIRY